MRIRRKEPYAAAADGSVTLQVDDGGSSTALATIVPTLTGGNHYTLLAYESGGAVKTLVLSEDFAVPAAGVATLYLYDAAIEAGKLDVYVTTNACTNLAALAPTTSFGTLTTPFAVALTQGPGTYNVCATGQGSKTDLRMSMPITLASQQVVTVLMTPASGGQLLNGSLLVQQGAYTAAPNTNVRVRLAAAVSGGATVAASASGGAVIDVGSVAPAFGYYVLVPASDTLNITVNGSSVGAPVNAPAGADATLLVYGSPGSATATMITDDNRTPSDATTVKLRMINGVTGGSTGTLTLTANNAPVGIGILPAAASGYVSVPVSINATAFGLTSATSGTLSPTPNSSPLTANTVYSILVGGDVAAPQLLIR
ncbi:MAG: DUF4397 domain-containing protein [Burkholderiaceae bacterium]